VFSVYEYVPFVVVTIPSFFHFHDLLPNFNINIMDFFQNKRTCNRSFDNVEITIKINDEVCKKNSKSFPHSQYTMKEINTIFMPQYLNVFSVYEYVPFVIVTIPSFFHFHDLLPNFNINIMAGGTR
jgi:hypothetical protein